MREKYSGSVMGTPKAGDKSVRRKEWPYREMQTWSERPGENGILLGIFNSLLLKVSGSCNHRKINSTVDISAEK
jgi:hypothetical protein